jgi:hypothetical protein
MIICFRVINENKNKKKGNTEAWRTQRFTEVSRHKKRRDMPWHVPVVCNHLYSCQTIIFSFSLSQKTCFLL